MNEIRFFFFSNHQKYCGEKLCVLRVTLLPIFYVLFDFEILFR